MYASAAGMNNTAKPQIKGKGKGKSNLMMLQQQKQKAPSDQECPKSKGVRLERAQMSAQFSKTELCKFNVLGICNKGSACAFAHNDVELKSRPDLSCTRLCRVFLQTGQCNDANCSFAHSKDQLRTTDFFHKTKLCRFWQAGHCILDDKCRFAHSTDEIQNEVMVKDAPQQPLRQQNLNGISGNATMMPAMLNQLQLLLKQREQLQQQLLSQTMQNLQQQDYQEQSSLCQEIYSGCATPEFLEFDTAPRQPLCPATLLDKLENASSCDSVEADSFQDKYYLPNSDTNSTRDLASPQPETTPLEDQWERSGSDSYDGSSTPEFPPMYGEAQLPLKMVPATQFHLPQLLAPVPQMNMIRNETGDAIEHYAGDVEITQAPLSDEHYVTPINGGWECNSGYQVKNTFISVKNTTNEPLRGVRSAAGRLTDMQNLM